MKNLFLLFAFILISGCSTVDKIIGDTDENSVDSQPWNTPEKWEGNVFGEQRY